MRLPHFHRCGYRCCGLPCVTQANDEEKRKYDRLVAELQKTVNEHAKAIDERDIKIGSLEAEAERRSETPEQVALRSEVDQLQQRLDAKEREVQAARRGEAEGQDRASSIQAAIRAAESAGAQKLADASRKADEVETRLKARLDDVTSKLDASKQRCLRVAPTRCPPTLTFAFRAFSHPRYTSLSEKFAQREDVIVELRARMDEYERGVHGLREEVQEKERFKALHEQCERPPC